MPLLRGNRYEFLDESETNTANKTGGLGLLCSGESCMIITSTVFD